VVRGKGSDGGSAQSAAVQDTLAEPQRTGVFGVALEDSVSKLEWSQSGGRALLAEKAAFRFKGWGEGLAGEEVTTVKAVGLGTEGAGVKHPRVWS